MKSYPIPNNKIGLGLRLPYVKHVIQNPESVAKDVGWLEVHSENYYGDGGPSIKSLVEIRKNFPISLHCVGNSLGSSDGIDLNHLEQLKKLIEIIDPFLVSDHISWGMVNNKHLNDLLPIPYTKEAMNVVVDNISKTQDSLKREILVENPSNYLAFKNSEIPEFEFINQISKKTGCKLLLDVNNIFVSFSNNNEFDPKEYLNKIDKKIVAEIHLAGHFVSKIFDGANHQEILIDTHNDKVRKEVWELYKIAMNNFGKIPSLIEWDQDYPEYSVLVGEARKAKNIMNDYA